MVNGGNIKNVMEKKGRGQQAWFLPMPLAGAWVNRWTFSSLPPPLPHLQSFVSLRYRTFLLGTENAMGGMGLWLSMPSCFKANYNR